MAPSPGERGLDEVGSTREKPSQSNWQLAHRWAIGLVQGEASAPLRGAANPNGSWSVQVKRWSRGVEGGAKRTPIARPMSTELIADLVRCLMGSLVVLLFF